MAENTEETIELEMSENVQQMVMYAFDEAAQKINEGILNPFTIILKGENLTIEEHDGDDPDEYRASAAKAILRDAEVLDGYAFAYDGFVELDGEDEARDAIVLEYAEIDSDIATVLCMFYDTVDEDGTTLVKVDEQIAVVGEAESLIPEEYRAIEE